MHHKLRLQITVLCIVIILYGCAGLIYVSASYPSLGEESSLSNGKVYRLGDLDYFDINDGKYLIVSGIEMSTYLFNERTLKSYDTSLIVPIPESLRGSGIGRIGRKPFVINLRMRVKEEGETFDPFSTELHIDGNEKAILPGLIFRDRNKLNACTYSEIPKNMGVEVTEGLVHIFNKSRVLTKSGAENENWSVPHWTCIQFRFNVSTPDPSTKFQLKLGEIVKSNGERIRPTIYFTPVTYKNYTH